MSRSYYEWMAAKRKWFAEQSYKVASVPYPHESIQYPIVYTRESTNPYWEQMRRIPARDLIPSSLIFSFKSEEIITFINSAADFEEAKEDDFLSQFYTQQDRGESRTEKFNILFQSRERYEELNNKIQDIINRRQFEKNKTWRGDLSKKENKANGATHEYFTGLAPNLSAIFMGYFMDAFEEVALPHFYESINDQLATDDLYFDKLDELFNDAVYQAIYTASERMSKITKDRDNGQGWGEEWRPIFEMLDHGDPRFRDIFTNTVREAIGPQLLNNLRDELRGSRRENRKLNTKDFTDIVYNSLGNIRAQKAQKGGFIQEVVGPMVTEYFNSSGRDGSIKVRTDRLGSNKTVTDFMHVWTKNMTFDLDKYMSQLRDAMESGSASTIRQVYQKMEDFYKKNDISKQLDKLYMVFVNAKNYSVGHDATNYTKSQRGKLKELPSFLEANGIKMGAARDFLLFAYNTGKGAIRYGERDKLTNEITNALKAAAANMMFDDYTQIGQGDTNSIHMYYLSGKYIPASVVLRATTQAIKEARSNVKANIQLPDPIDDKFDKESTERGQGWGGSTNAEIKQNIYDHWVKESEEAQAVSNWEVSFTLRIKQLVSDTKI